MQPSLVQSIERGILRFGLVEGNDGHVVFLAQSTRYDGRYSLYSANAKDTIDQKAYFLHLLSVLLITISIWCFHDRSCMESLISCAFIDSCR